MKRILPLVGVAALVACSSSDNTAPTPTLAGTWHVSIQSLDSGTITPSTFDVNVKSSGSGYVVSMPTLVWSGGMTFNAPASLVAFSTDTLAGFGTQVFGLNYFAACGAIEIYGRPSSNKDSLANAKLLIADTMISLSGSPACQGRWHGTISAKKTGGPGSPPAPPAPAPAGSWQVTMGAATTGTVTPNPFTADIVAAANTLGVTMPSLTYSVGPTVFDSTPFAFVTGDTLTFGVLQHNGVNECQLTYFAGVTRGDTTDGTMFVLDTNTVAPLVVPCRPRSFAPFRAHK